MYVYIYKYNNKFHILLDVFFLVREGQAKEEFEVKFHLKLKLFQGVYIYIYIKIMWL